MNKLNICAVSLTVYIATGCTKGQFIDSENASGQNDVDVRLDSWPPPEQASPLYNPDFIWPSNWNYSPDYDTMTFQGGDTKGLFGFDYQQAQCIPDVDDVSIYSPYDDQWFRIKAEKTGFDTYVSYRYHDYDETCNVVDCDTGDTVQRKCEDWKEFNIDSSTAPRKALPDLMVDVRSLKQNYIYCAWHNSAPGSGFAPDDISIRASLGTANVGSGLFYVEQPRPGSDCSTDNHCPSGTICNVNTERCIPQSCTSSFQCPPELECSSGKCKPKSCTAMPDGTSSCSVDGGLNSCLPTGTCSPHPVTGNKPCNASSDCTVAGTTCSNGFCVGRACNVLFNPCPSPTTALGAATQCYQGICQIPDENQAWCHYDSDCLSSNDCIIDRERCIVPTLQVISGENGQASSRKIIDAPITYHPNHQHLHLDSYAEMAIIKHDESCRIDLDRREDYQINNQGSSWEEDCLVNTGGKISFCVTDLGEFDREIQNLYGPNRFFEGDAQCYRVVQGLTPGWKDVYAYNLVGQMIWLGNGRSPIHISNIKNTYSGKEFYLEAYVDPDEIFDDRNRDNNWARVNISFPTLDDSQPLWWEQFCDVEIDCRLSQADPDISPEEDICAEYRSIN